MSNHTSNTPTMGNMAQVEAELALANTVHHLTIKYNIYTLTPTLAHPDAVAGLHGDVYTFRVENIPDNVPTSHVLRVFDHTAIVHPDKLPTPYTVEYRQLGVGKVIRSGVLIRADQVKPDMVFCCTNYPGAGIRTCHGSHLRQTGGDTTIVIDCGVGVSPLELSLSDELEVLGGAA